jgi:hypothetical protein
VHVEVFRLFLEAVKGASVTITNQNFSELSQLCSEFAFSRLTNELTALRGSGEFKDDHICALEDIEHLHRAVADLRSLLRQGRSQIEAAFASLRSELAASVPIPQAKAPALPISPTPSPLARVDSQIVSDFPPLFE